MPNFVTKLKHRAEDESIDIGILSGFTRIPYALHPKEYQITQSLYDFRTELENHIDRLFKGDIDAGNFNALDQVILSKIAEAVADLSRQRAEHSRQISDIISQQAGTKREADFVLEDCSKELIAIEKELTASRELYQEVNSPRQSRAWRKDRPIKKERNGDETCVKID
jgi:hypothetical protein